MKELPVLDQGVVLTALVDDEDYSVLAATTWRAHRAARSATTYARGVFNGKRALLHRAIMGEAAGECVDHIDGNGLNCQRQNLRAVTRAQNNVFHVARKAFDAWEDRL